jgi:hypothetical protein
MIRAHSATTDLETTQGHTLPPSSQQNPLPRIIGDVSSSSLGPPSSHLQSSDLRLLGPNVNLTDPTIPYTNGDTLPSTNMMVGMSNIFDNEFVNSLDDTDFNSNLDWLFDNMSGDDFTDGGDFYLGSNTFPADEHIDQPSAIRAPPEPTHGDGHMSKGATTPREPEAAILDLPTIPHSEDNCSPDDPWPMEWHAEFSQKPLELPDLGADDDEENQYFSRLYSSWSLRPSTVDALFHYIRLPTQRSPWQSVNLKHLPSKEKLEYCIGLYFAHHHQVRSLSVSNQPPLTYVRSGQSFISLLLTPPKISP